MSYGNLMIELKAELDKRFPSSLYYISFEDRYIDLLIKDRRFTINYKYIDKVGVEKVVDRIVNVYRMNKKGRSTDEVDYGTR